MNAFRRQALLSSSGELIKDLFFFLKADANKPVLHND